MKKSLFFLLFLLVLVSVAGCKSDPPPAPQIVCTRLENDVFQFQYDNGAALDMGKFLTYLDDWLKDHPEVTVKSVVPQITDKTYREGKSDVTRTVTNGVLVFALIDRDREKTENTRRAKEAEDHKKAQEGQNQ